MLVLLGVSGVLTLLSMVMAIQTIRAETKDWSNKLWIVLSCMTVVVTIGVGYVAMTIDETEQAHYDSYEQSEGKESTQAASVKKETVPISNVPTSNETVMPASNVKTTVASQESPRSQAESNSLDYLVEILEALKKGQPIPEQYLNMLSVEDRQKAENIR